MDNEVNGEWGPLSREEIDDAIQLGFTEYTPGDGSDFDRFLIDHGYNPETLSAELEAATRDNDTNRGWGPLTPEEIDDAIQLGFTEYTPGDQADFDRFLIDHGYNPEKLKNELEGRVSKGTPTRNNPTETKEKEPVEIGEGTIGQGLSLESELRRIFDNNGISITDEDIKDLIKNNKAEINGEEYQIDYSGADGYDYTDEPAVPFKLVVMKDKEKQEEEKQKNPEEPIIPENENPVPPKDNPIPPKEPGDDPVPPKGPGDDPVPPKGPGDDTVPPTGNNLPVVSGLQVYNKVLQEVGKIKGTKLIKWHDMMQHVAIVGRPIAGVMRLVSGRKKEQKRIINAIEDIDFEKEFGLTTDQAMDLMIDDCLLKDGTRSITQLKVNDIFLRALHQKLGKDMQRRRSEIENSDKFKALQQRMGDLKKERTSASPERAKEIDIELSKLNKANDIIYVKPVQDLNDRCDGIERGRREKSYEKKSNIEGADAAVRDIDSREVIKKLADIEKGKLIAEREGRTEDADVYKLKMDEFMDSQTMYKKAFLGKGKVSIGAFEKPIGKPKIMSNRDYLFMKVATGIGAASIFSALALKNQIEKAGEQLEWAQQQQAKVDQALVQQQQKIKSQLNGDISKAQNAVDAQTNQLNQMGSQVRAAQNRITGNDADMAVQAVRKPSIEAQTVGERAASHAGGFNESTSQYINADQANVAFATKHAQGTESYINSTTGKGTDISRFVDALRQKAAGERANSQLIQSAEQNAASYYSDPAHLLSHAGVDHTTVANMEANLQTITNNADIQATETAADVIEMLSKINAAGANKVDLANMIGVPSLDPIIIAGKEQGIDWLSVFAPEVLGINKAVDDKAKNNYGPEKN